MIVELAHGDDRDATLARMTDALAGAGVTMDRPRFYAMDRFRSGMKQRFRPDEVCASCGWIPDDDLNGDGHCVECESGMAHNHDPAASSLSPVCTCTPCPECDGEALVCAACNQCSRHQGHKHDCKGCPAFPMFK